jgi:hypothetical protein
LTVWLNILRRVPGSVRWLLEASVRSSSGAFGAAAAGAGAGAAAEEDDPQQNLSARQSIHRACQAVGISPARVIFAPRLNKAQHIARQLVADVFLDTLVYGAHSTATDALRGGLPVLTLAGHSFPSRVGMSLYASLCAADAAACQRKDDSSGQGGAGGVAVNARLATSASHNQRESSPSGTSKNLSPSLCAHFVRSSTKDFEDFAVHLVSTTSGQSLLQAMTSLLARSIHFQMGIFGTERATRSFLLGMEALKEARVLEKREESLVYQRRQQYSVFRPDVTNIG